MKLIVQTFLLATGEMETQKTINHDDREDRVRLARHCYWAFRNGRSVTTFAAST